jgi:hypothetical protein
MTHTQLHCLCQQVNLALKELPRFTCLPEPLGQHRTTTHLLPDEGSVMASLSAGFADVQAGRLPEFPTIEWCVRVNVNVIGLVLVWRAECTWLNAMQCCAVLKDTH